MKIFKDMLNGDELLSDSFPLTLVDDVVYEVQTKMITVTEGNYDIGANPSEEEAEEALDSGAVTVNNLVSAMRLEQTQFDKKSYMAYIKGYMKSVLTKLKETNPERADAFQKSIQPFIKKVLDNFDEYSFYTGASMDPEGMIALQFYKEDGITPYFYFFKDGLLEEKV
jgi:hypothetical protein